MRVSSNIPISNIVSGRPQTTQSQRQTGQGSVLERGEISQESFLCRNFSFSSLTFDRLRKRKERIVMILPASKESLSTCSSYSCSSNPILGCSSESLIASSSCSSSSFSILCWSLSLPKGEKFYLGLFDDSGYTLSINRGNYHNLTGFKRKSEGPLQLFLLVLFCCGLRLRLRNSFNLIS